MAAFAGICSSGVRFRGKESGSLAQYHGLRPVESKKMASAMVRPSGSISSPGGFSHSSIFNLVWMLHWVFICLFLGVSDFCVDSGQ